MATIKSLENGLEVFKRLMDNHQPMIYHNAKQIAELCSDIGDYQKIYRIVETLKKCDYLEERNQQYRISDDMLFLAQRYLLSLATMHKQIVSEASKFDQAFEKIGEANEK